MDSFNITKKVALFSLFLSLSTNCKAQEVTNKSEETADSSIFTKVQILPEFPGGMMGFHTYVSKMYKIPSAFKGSGYLILNFIVEKDGSVSDLKVMRDLGYGTGEEAIRILKIAPKWKPGIQDGVPVRVSYNLPIKLSAK